MRSLTRFVAVLGIFVLFAPLAYAQSVPLLTITQAQQPSNAPALPSQTVPAVAVTLTAGAGSSVTITALDVALVGSANPSIVAGLQVNENATTVVGSETGAGSAAVSIPVSLTLAAGESETLLVSAVMPGSLSGDDGQGLQINITGIETTAVLQGTLPVYGAQLTLGSGYSKPVCSLSANPSVYSVGQTVDLVWSSSGATSGTITGLGSVGTQGLQGILPSGSGTYTGTFTGPGGTGTCQTSVTLNTGGTSGIVGGGGTVGGAGGVATPGAGTTVGPTVGGGTCDGGVGNCTSGYTGNGEPTTPQASGLLTCNGVNCSACNVASLMQNIINTLIGLSIPLAASMFAWAGILYFTSAANQHNLERAKSIFKTVFWGFLLVICGWLIVQTLLHAILSPQQFQSWNTIQCTNISQRPGTVNGTGGNSYTVSNWLSSILPGLNTSAPSGGIGVSQTSVNNGCPSGYSIQPGGFCMDSTGDIVNPSTTAGGGSSIMQAIYAQESSSGANTTAVNSCNSWGACGGYQIKPATACITNSQIPGCGSDGSVSDLSQVQSYLTTQNSQSAQDLATQIYNNNLNSQYCNGSVACAVAEYNGGVAAVKSSADCASGYAYQCPYDSLSASTGTYCNGSTVTDCTANTGFIQTRDYVASVCSKASCN